jgi:hypothetical protein
MSNETKVTAVGWLIPKILELNLQLSLRKISARSCELEIAKLFEQAQAMEKEQMDKVSEDWFVEGCSHMKDNKRIYQSFEQYYNENYGN